MKTCSNKFWWVILAVSFLSSGIAAAQDNSCKIMGPAQTDVWVIVYDADSDGNRNQVLWKGRIAAGKQVEVTSTAGSIRYDYTLDPNQPYAGDVDRWCYDGLTIQVE